MEPVGDLTGVLLHGRDAGDEIQQIILNSYFRFFYKLQQLRHDVHQIPILLIRKLII